MLNIVFKHFDENSLFVQLNKKGLKFRPKITYIGTAHDLSNFPLDTVGAQVTSTHCNNW
jgi:hypothetical protein